MERIICKFRLSSLGGSVRGDGSNSMNGSLWDSLDIGDGGPLYGDSIADNISKFILRFVERVCLEADITTEHLKSFQQLVPGKLKGLGSC